LKHENPGRLVKEAVSTASSPKAIGPYSQAVKASGFIFVSGQLPLDPATGSVVPGDASMQTERVLENLKFILLAAGSSISKVVKTTIFLADLNDFAAVNEVYGRHFAFAPPARSTVEVVRLPKDVKIEIDLIAVT
jgi:2-iminobutanoate/2-iminopropanoate deaminase